MRTSFRVAATPMRQSPTTIRTFATRTGTIDTLRARRKTSPRPVDQPTKTTSNTNPNLTLPSHGGGVFFGSDWAHWESSSHNPFTADDRACSFYSTQIYHGQRPSATSSPASTSTLPAARNGPKPPPNRSITTVTPGPATGAGTGVPIAAQMFGNDIKANPTESEADVAADRCGVDPLPAQFHHHTVDRGPGDAATPRPTESEEDVSADRGLAGEDPLAGMRGARSREGGGAEKR
ncbi:hypothetical protein VTK26DRAFT_1748 [Humicola hyalothermophila]